MAAYTTIDDPSSVFQCTLYTGTGGARSVTNTGNSDLQPDMVWIKARNLANEKTRVVDSVRGTTVALKITDSAGDSSESGGLTAFNSDGFSLGAQAAYNNNTNTFVSWQWKKVAGVFDIQTYAGNNTGSRQVSHNLGVVPSLIIIKNRTNSSSWWVGSTEISFTWNTDYLQLNETAAKGTDGGGHIFGAVPTSSYFVPGDNNDTNGNSNNYVSYLFGNKQGVSKVGNYTGNGNADGTFVYTGFRPAWIMQKSLTTTYGWQIYDNRRTGFNGDNDELLANTNATETDGSGNEFPDILSNGFKLRNTDINKNANGVTYIYIAFAENPLVTSTGVPTTAR